jgi:antitoxin VapB
MVQNWEEGGNRVPLNIRNEEAHRLACTLAKLTGESLTEAVVKALRERLQRESGESRGTDLAEELMEIGRRCAALPVLDPRSPEEILGYDENGLPR